MAVLEDWRRIVNTATLVPNLTGNLAATFKVIIVTYMSWLSVFFWTTGYNKSIGISNTSLRARMIHCTPV